MSGPAAGCGWSATPPALRGPDGSLGSITVVVEPAKAAEIAEELFLSTHTIRDHVKAIFHGVGVSSRGELVAKLYAEHYEPVHFEHAVHADLA